MMGSMKLKFGSIVCIYIGLCFDTTFAPGPEPTASWDDHDIGYHDGHNESAHMERHHNVSGALPEYNSMQCLAQNRLLTGEIAEVVNRVMEAEHRFVAIEQSIGQMMNFTNVTDLHALACGLSFTQEEFNCSEVIPGGGGGGSNDSNPIAELMNELGAAMASLNETLADVHRLAASGEFERQMQENFFKARGHELEMWKHCLQSGGDHGHWDEYEQAQYSLPPDRFLETTSYKTLLRLGFIRILESRNIDPVEYFNLPDTSDDVWIWERPYIGFDLLRRVEPRRVANLSWSEVMDLLQTVEMDRDAYAFLLSHIDTSKFETLLLTGRELVLEDGMPPPSVLGGIIDATTAHWGPPGEWTPEDIDALWLFAVGLDKHHILQLSTEAFITILPNFKTLYHEGQLDPFIAGIIVDVAKRQWGPQSRWTMYHYEGLGPFMRLLTVNDLARIDMYMLHSMLPHINDMAFDRRQGQAIVNNIARASNWTWSAEQFESLGGLSAYLTVRQVKRLPRAVFSDPEMKRTIMENQHGRGRGVKEVAKMIVEDMGDPSTWSQEDVAQIGKVASGLEVKDLEKIPMASIRDAVADLSEAELSPRQRAVIAKKYRAASTNATSKRLRADDIQEMKSLAAGLGSEVFAEMSPDDVKEAIEVLSENAAEMKPTQKREIVRQMRRASGGIAGSLKDLGSMVKEVPLKDLNDMSLEDIGTDIAETDDSSEDPVLTMGTIQWNKGQSTKLFRKVKNELLSGGNQSSTVITSSTLSMLGTVMVGMTCDDIGNLETHDIFRLTDVMMKQAGWTLRQTRCISQKVRDFVGTEADFMANFSTAEVSSLTGSIMKEFMPEELSHLPLSTCDIAFADIGQQRDMEEIRRDKRHDIAALALKCMEKDSSSTTITGDDMESLGYLCCELMPEALSRIDVTDLRTNTLEITSQCCYDRFQMVAIGEKIVAQLGSTNLWDSSTLESVSPFLLYLSPNYIQTIDQDELSLVAEAVMDLYSRFDEKLPLCERDLEPEDLEERQAGFVRVALKVKDTMVATAESARRRRRRDVTYEPSCDEIEVLEGGNIAWTVEELSAMSGDTFSNCVYVLGTVADLSTDQLDALKDKSAEVWGEPSDLSNDEISQLGVIATRFTPDELSQLNLTNIDSVYAIAQHDGWSSEQMEAAVNQYLSASETDLSSLDSVELTGLNQFVCGLTGNQIGQLSSSAYGDSASALGTLEVCAMEQLTAFKAHAVENFGEITAWQPEEVAEVGVVVAGFTAEELSSLNISAIAGITPLAITLIPPTTFGNGFTANVLESFDEAQSLAVTTDQLATLDSDQLLALTAAAYGGVGEIPDDLRSDILGEEEEDDDDDSASGAGINQPVVLSFLLVAVIAEFLPFL